MPLLNFKKEFADDVMMGRKRMTIRKKRKRPIKKGDDLHLYTGLRTKHTQFLGLGKCLKIQEVTMTELGMVIAGQSFAWNELDALAIADGFNSAAKFKSFFQKQYGFPLDAEIIAWC